MWKGKLLTNLYAMWPVVPIGSVTALSGVGTWRKLNLFTDEERNYLAKIQLTNISNSNNEIKDEDILGDRKRLKDFYDRYSHENISVNYQKGNNLLDFYLHFRSSRESKNLNRLWMENVKLNQLSIDRYGLEYNDSGNKKVDSSNKVRSIVDWKDICFDTVRYTPPEGIIDGYISFNLRKKIPGDEIRILANEDVNQYKTEDGAVADWFIWLDKELLALRLNYIFQAYVFGGEETRDKSSVQAIIGSEGSRNDAQSSAKGEIENNFKTLTQEEKEFARDYISLFFKEGDSIDYEKVVQRATGESNFITPDDLNRIYNKFRESNKGINVFSGHLIGHIKSSNWSDSFNFKKDKDTETRPKPQELSNITCSSGRDEGKVIRVFVDRMINPFLSADDLHGFIYKYGVRNFALKTTYTSGGSTTPKRVWSTGIYSQSEQAKSHQAYSVIGISRESDYGF